MKKGQAGFTLVELLVVILIIGILAGLLLPQFGNIRDRANDTKCGSNVKNLATALESYNAINETYPTAANYTAANLIVNGNMLLCPFDGVAYTYTPTVAAGTAVQDYDLECTPDATGKHLALRPASAPATNVLNHPHAFSGVVDRI